MDRLERRAEARDSCSDRWEQDREDSTSAPILSNPSLTSSHWKILVSHALSSSCTLYTWLYSTKARLKPGSLWFIMAALTPKPVLFFFDSKSVLNTTEEVLWGISHKLFLIAQTKKHNVASHFLLNVFATALATYEQNFKETGLTHIPCFKVIVTFLGLRQVAYMLALCQFLCSSSCVRAHTVPFALWLWSIHAQKYNPI